MPRSRRRTLAGLVVTATVADGIAFSGAPAAHAAEPDPILIAGNFIDDGINRDEIIHYQPGTGTDYMFWDWQRVGTSASFLPEQLISVNGTYTPIVGDFDGDGFDEVFWYSPNAATDYIWDFPNGDLTGGPVSYSFTVNESYYRPVAGDFTGDGADDIIWYAPGTYGDSIWDFDPGSGFNPTPSMLPNPINANYRLVAGHYTGANTIDDILWWRTDGSGVVLWENDGGDPGALSVGITPPSGTGYWPFGIDTRNDGYDDIFWYRPGSGTESYWDFTQTGMVRSEPCCAVGGTYKNAVGDLFGDGHDDIVWMNDTTTGIWDWHLNTNGELVRESFSLPSAAAAGALDAAIATSTANSSATRRTTPDNDRVVIEFSESDARIETNQGTVVEPIS